MVLINEKIVKKIVQNVQRLMYRRHSYEVIETNPYMTIYQCHIKDKITKETLTFRINKAEDHLHLYLYHSVPNTVYLFRFNEILHSLESGVQEYLLHQPAYRLRTVLGQITVTKELPLQEEESVFHYSFQELFKTEWEHRWRMQFSGLTSVLFPLGFLSIAGFISFLFGLFFHLFICLFVGCGLQVPTLYFLYLLLICTIRTHRLDRFMRKIRS